MTLIAVTGATGAVGGRVARLLAEQGAIIRLIVRPGHDLGSLPKADVRVVAGYSAEGEMRAALQGSDTLFLVPAHEGAHRVDEHRTAIKAAVVSGVKRIVYLSFFGAAPDATFTLARDHYYTEEAVRDSGLDWTFLRMNLYIDFIPSMTLPDGEIRGPAGDGRLSAVRRDDVAASAAVVLSRQADQRATYELTGPESLTLSEAAETMSRETGKSIRFVNETDEEAYDSRATYEAPRFEVEGWVSTYQAIRDGSLSRVTSDVELLTGHPPGTLRDYLSAHPESLNHVRPSVDQSSRRATGQT